MHAETAATLSKTSDGSTEIAGTSVPFDTHCATRRRTAVCSVYKHPLHCDFSVTMGAKVCMDVASHVSVAVCVTTCFYGDLPGWRQCKSRWSIVLCDESRPWSQHMSAFHNTSVDEEDDETCSVRSCPIGLW